MTSQDFSLLCSLVNTLALTSYDIVIVAQLVFVSGGLLMDSMCACPDGFKREKATREEYYNNSSPKNFRNIQLLT